MEEKLKIKIDIIKSFYSLKNQEMVDKKIAKFLNDKSRGEEFENLLLYLEEPNIDFYNLYQNGAKKLAYQGLIIEEKEEEYHYYGHVLNKASNEVIEELINQLMAGNSIDNFLNDYNDNKKPLHLIVKLLLFTMNNYYQNYDLLISSNQGIIDYKINLLTKNRSLYQSVPVNDFIYGIFIDGLHTEKQFDKYLTKGSYQLLCEQFDKLFDNTNDIIDNNLIKIQLINIGNMFNNKLFYFSYYGIIDLKTKDILIKQFNQIFNQVLQAFSITFYEEDYPKIEEAMNSSLERLNVVKNV